MQDSPTRNRLLAALPPPVLAQWLPLMDCVDLPADAIVPAAGAPAEHLYFPGSALLALLQETGHGPAVPVALVGCDGVLSAAPLFDMAGLDSPARVVQPGSSWRLPVSALDLLDAQPETRSAVLVVVLRYLQLLTTQMAQTALCRRHHGLEQRLAHWLSLGFATAGSDHLQWDLNRLAQLLDVDAPRLDKARAVLTAAGAIECGTQGIGLQNQAALGRLACDCHAVLQAEAERLQASVAPLSR
ncbi:Crp/Fnr family transcriptional regulator [Hydrogenophaga sp. RWCD_12]|uniref:Crp/Fnr family transcriptional regulator n=1 Tax=Hydrogenophaga sp. RWCD_12 TaxID=3391190 RepID=UPI003984C8C7